MALPLKNNERSTREVLLETALELFWLNSYGTVSVDEICKAANVKKGSFYHFFGSKLDLAVACFDYAWAYWKTQLDEAFSTKYSPEQRIKNYVKLDIDAQKEKYEQYGKVLGCPFSTCGAEQSTQEEKLRLKIEESFKDFEKYFENVLKDHDSKKNLSAAEIKNEADAMIAFTCGLTTQAKIKNDLSVLTQQLEPGLMKYLKY